MYIYTNDRLLSDQSYTPLWFSEDEVPMEGEAEVDEGDDSTDLSVLAAPLTPISECITLE